MKEIYFIRHGETDWNVLKKSQGAEADIPLNDNGRLQSLKTGEYLKKYRLKNIKADGSLGLRTKQFDCVFTSPMIRARETCEIICDEIGYTGKIREFKELIEHRRGKFSGANKKENALYQEYFKKFDEMSNEIKDPIEKFKFENEGDDILNDLLNIEMEPSEESEKRAKEFIHKLKIIKCSKILVVSHSGFLYSHLLPNMFNIPKGMILNQPPFLEQYGSNCTITYVNYNEDEGEFKMITPPNTLHLGLKDL